MASNDAHPVPIIFKRFPKPRTRRMGAYRAQASLCVYFRLSYRFGRRLIRRIAAWQRAKWAQDLTRRAGENRDGGLPFFVAHNPFCMLSQVQWVSDDRAYPNAAPSEARQHPRDNGAAGDHQNATAHD